MSGHWAALASASIIAALYGGMAAASGRMPALVHACPTARSRLQRMSPIHDEVLPAEIAVEVSHE